MVRVRVQLRVRARARARARARRLGKLTLSLIRPSHASAAPLLATDYFLLSTP